MEKLIEHFTKNGEEYEAILACKNHCKNGGIASCSCKPIIEVRKKLFQYESTGLKPDEIPQLKSEVEQLTAENEQNANYAEIYQDICDKYGKNFRALLDKAKALQAEIATLKKALELAIDRALPNSSYSVKQAITRNLIEECAQQLTHETHGEAEKK